MKTSLFGATATRLLSLFLMCTAYSLLHAAALAPVLQVRFDLLALDGFIDALLFCALAMALSIIVKYGNYTALSRHQQFINYAALGLLTVGLWVALGYLASCLFFDRQTVNELNKEVWMDALIGILGYTIAMQYLLRAKTDDYCDAELEQPDRTEPKDADTQSKNVDAADAEPFERVTVKTGQKIHVIVVSDIIYIRSDGDYVQIYAGNSRYVKEETMKYFETRLPRQQFVRVHRSYIVNVEMILRIELFEKQNQLLILKNGDRIKASAAGYKALRAALNL